jgi:hypothetical protein
MLNSHCQVCEFKKDCQEEATARDELSLLRGMAEAEIQKYARRGIFTVTQLSCTFRPPRRRRKHKDRRVSHSHALQAMAIREKKVHVLGSPQLPDRLSRIYLDVEGDPERGFCYLVGVIVREGEMEKRHSLWVDSPTEEPKLLDGLLAIATEYPDAGFYAYGGFEASFLRRIGKASGKEPEVEQLLARLCNVLSLVYTHVYFPIYCNGLKYVAGYLGFRWTDPSATGIQSVVWRHRWEESGCDSLKQRLMTYNLEDCEALRHVTEFLYLALAHFRATGDRQVSVAGQNLAQVEELDPISSRPHWCCVDFAVPDFEFVNQRAYFDYQRDRVYIRTSKCIRKSVARSRTRKCKRTRLRANQIVEIRCETCPSCGSPDLVLKPDRRLARVAHDLRIRHGQIRRWVTQFTTMWHYCAKCQRRFLPLDYLRLEEFFHSLKSWAMYEYVAHRTTLASIAETVRDCFAVRMNTSQVFQIKQALGRYYAETCKVILERMRMGSLIHADETEVMLRPTGKGYVWVFASLEEVVFMYRQSRQGDFLHDLLRDFRGVLVTDFYAAYDSLPCPQQKCLIHLIRDFNHDIQRHPWDEDLKSLGSNFGSLLRRIIATIDQYGLKRRHLGKHEKDVNRFFQAIAGNTLRSQVAESYRQRLLKSRDKLFTFLEYDLA